MPKHTWAHKKAGIVERNNFENTITGTILSESKSYVVTQVGEYTKTTFTNLIKNSTKRMEFYGKNFNPLTVGSVSWKAALSAANKFTGGLDKMVSATVNNMVEYQIHGIKGAKLCGMTLDQQERSESFSLANIYSKYGIEMTPQMTGYIGDGLTGLVSKWEWQNRFREDAWRDRIIPHLLKEQFKDVLASVQSGIVAQYGSNPNKKEMNEKLAQASKELADLFHDYSVDLANNTEALGTPIHFLPDPELQAKEREDIQTDPDIPLEEKANILKEMDLQEPLFTSKDLEKFTAARVKGTPYKSNLGPLQTKEMTRLGLKPEIPQTGKKTEPNAKTEEDRKKLEEEITNTVAKMEVNLQEEDENEVMIEEAESEDLDLSEWDPGLDENALNKEATQSLPKWQQKMFGFAPRVERGYISSMTNGLYQYVASAGYDWAGKTANAAMKRMAKAAYDPMTLAGMDFNKRTVAGRVKGTVVGRYADMVSDYIKSFGNPDGPFFVTGDAVAKEAFETYDFDEKMRNDFYNEVGFEFDSTAVLKGIAEDIRKWEDKDQFYDKNWREQIIPHILRTSFQRELDKVQKSIVDRYQMDGLNNRAALEYKLSVGTRLLANMYQDYSVQLAEKTGMLEMPLFCVANKNVMNNEELKILLGPQKYASFKKKFEAQPPLINEKKIRESVNRAMGRQPRQTSAQIREKTGNALRAATESSKTYEPALLMKAISDVRELEARCAKTGFFGRNIPFFNRSYLRTMAMKEQMKEEIRNYVGSRQPRPDLELEQLFDLKTPFEVDSNITRQMEGREFRKEFPQKSMMEKVTEMAANAVQTTVETVQTVTNVTVQGAKMVYNVLTSEGGQKVMQKVADTVVNAGLNTMMTVGEYTIEAGTKISNMTLNGIEKVANTVNNVVEQVADRVSTITENVTNTMTNIVTGTGNAIQTGVGYVTGTLQYGMDTVTSGFNYLFGGSDPIPEDPEEDLSLMSEEEAREIDETFVKKVVEHGGIEALQKEVPDPEVLKEIAPEIAKQIREPGPEPEIVTQVQKPVDEPETVIVTDAKTGEQTAFTEIPEEPGLDQVMGNTEFTINDEYDEYEEGDSIYEDMEDPNEFMNGPEEKQEEPKPDPVTEKREALNQSISDFRKSLQEKQNQLRESMRTVKLSEAADLLAGLIITSALDQAAADNSRKLNELDPQLPDEVKLAEFEKTEKNLNQYKKQMEESEYSKRVEALKQDPKLRLSLTGMISKTMKIKDKLILMADDQMVAEQYVNTYRAAARTAAQKQESQAPVKAEAKKTLDNPIVGGPTV